MQLNVGNYIRGVRCDLTGEEMFDLFTYYSMSGQPYYVDQSKMVINPGPADTLDIDMSEMAFANLWEQVRQNLGDAKKNMIKCDLSQRYLSGEFTYWKVNIKKVAVKIEQTDSPDKMNASVVAQDSWDLNISDEEAQILMELQKKHCAEPFDENNAPKVSTKRDVLRIPAPSTKPEPPVDIHHDGGPDEAEFAKQNRLERYKDYDQIDEDTPEIGLGIYADEPALPDPEPEPEPKPTPTPQPRFPEPIEKPNIAHVVENNPAFFTNRVQEIINKDSKPKKKHPASPDTPEPDIDFEPEVTKKTELPDTGVRVNIKRRKKK